MKEVREFWLVKLEGNGLPVAHSSKEKALEKVYDMLKRFNKPMVEIIHVVEVIENKNPA